MGRAVRPAGSARVHPARAAANCGFRAGGNLHRDVQPCQAHLRSGARSGRADHRRLRDFARRHAGERRRKWNRYRLQLLAEGAGMSAGPFAHHGFAARARAAEGSQDAGAIVVSRSAADRRILHGPKISPHGIGDALLRVARSFGAGGRRRAAGAMGAAPKEPSRRSSRESRRWGCGCTWRMPRTGCGR